MLFKKTQLLVFLFTIIFSSFTFSQTTCYDTSWDKAVDFDGANQNLKQVSSATNVNALRMGGTTYSPPANADNSETTNSTEARPWATTIVFKADGNNSNQYIWNQGEGTGTNADNIYLRLTAAGSLMFGWGREGDGYNEVRIANQNISSSNWYGVYIAHKGYRPSSGAAASATNLTFAFDIRIMSSADSFTATGTNLSAVSSNWISSGIPMNRAVTGDFTIGGIGAERSFHGKVASMVVTTLKVNQVMPSDSEIKLMITDPEKWLADYKVGNAYRPCTSDTNGTFAMNSLASSGATQVWLMGDGTSDSYSNGIRNEVNPTEQNIAKLQLDNNMQNSIQSVNISGFLETACRATSAIFGTETTSTLNLESFTAPSGGADGYAIYINDSNSFTAPSNGDEPTADLSWNGSGQQPVYFGTSASPNITVTDLDPGTTYYFQVYAYNNSSGTETYETTGLNASDDTTAPVIPGITLEGPNANQSGTNLSDVDDWGWASLNNPLGAGERVVFNNDFMLDIFSSMPDNYVVRIGLKDGSWDNSEGNGRDGFLGGTFLLIRRQSVDNGSISLWANGLPSFTSVTLSSSISLTDKFSAFIELDALGDIINIGLNSTDFSDELDVYSTAYCNWTENAKATTNNEIGYNISTVDVMIRGAAEVNNQVGFDAADVDWSEISQVAVPSPAPTSQATSAVFGSETSTSLNLTSFTAPAGGANGYVIYVNDTNSFTAPTDGDEPTTDLSWSGSGQQAVYFGTSVSPNITVTDLNPGTTYYYKVYAYKNCLESETYEAIGLNANDTTALGVLTITGITGNNKVYDTTTAATTSGTATLVGVDSDHTVTLSGTPVFTFASVNVGTGITINTTGYTLSGTDAAKYTLTQPTLSGDITRRSITLTASNQEKVYGDVHDLGDTAFTVVDLDGDAILPNGEVVTNVTVNSATGVDSSTTSDAATYTDEIVISGPVAGSDGTGDGFLESNYDISYVAGDLTVNRRAAQIIASVQEKDYGYVHDLGDIAFTVVDRDGEALPNGETVNTVTLVSENGIDASTDANVGTYADNISVTPTSTNDPTITGSENFNQENYTFSYDTADLTINQANLTITGIIGSDKVYDDTTAATASGTATLSGIIGADDVILGGSPAFTFASANVGTGITINTTGYTISGTDSGNYTLTQPTLSGDITAKELTITGITGDNKVYDDTTASTATGTAALSGIIGADDVILGGSPVFTFASANVDTGITITTTGYTISGTDSGNYTLTQPTLSGDISAKELTITGITGDDKVYDGTTAATATGTAILTGVEAGDDVILGGSPVFTFASASVGTGITITTTSYTISGTDSGNYTLTQPALSGDITPADLNVTADSATKVYGATDPVLTYTITGFQGTDTEADLDTAVSISRAVGEDVGTYTITPSAAADSNYTVSFVTADFTITQAALTVTGSDQTKVYGATDPVLTYTITGFINGDTEADLDTAVSISRAAGEDVGTYTITPSAAASNYTVSFVTADFTITQATLTITGLVGKNKVYDETTLATSTGIAALVGVVSNDDVSLGGSPVFTFEVPDPGIFIMITTTGYTITGSDSGNYILIQPTLYADITDPDEDCDGDGIIDTEDTDFSSCASAIRNTTRYGFSPNEDGINDVWFIENIFVYPNNTVKVFNRSGKLVFKQRGYQNDWKGESNQVSSGRSGNKLPTGPYIFMLDLGEGNELIRGWLYINY